MNRTRRLTDTQEADILQKVKMRKKLSEEAICAQYYISRSTLREAVKRAQAREAAKETQA